MVNKRIKTTGLVLLATVTIAILLLRIGIKETSLSRTRGIQGKSVEKQGQLVFDNENARLNYLRSVAERIRMEKDPSTARSLVRQLVGFLRQLRPDVASSTLQNFLDSKVDAQTRLGFHIGPNGFLTESPTLRVLCLDVLGQIDPRAATAYAENILSSRDSPDEWAVALRNYAFGNPRPDASPLLHEKMQTILTYQPWLANPSEGFLQAFDVAVYLGGTDLVPLLGDLVRRQDNQAVAHAAYLALDRLTINDPVSNLSFLAANPDVMEGREITRANYFARADVRDAAQRQVLERYLLNPSLADAELNAFAGLYPNANFMVSQNLLTTVITPNGAWLAARDTEALKVVGDWLQDPSFTRLRPQLNAIQHRLESFVNQTKVQH